MTILKNEYFTNVTNLIKSNKIEKQYFEVLYKLYLGEKINIDKDYLVDKIISQLFPMYSNEPMIPFAFFDTPIGKVILSVKYGITNENFYYVKDISNILNISKQAVLKKIKLHKIAAHKSGRDWIINETDLNKYLIRKGETPVSEKSLYKYMEQEEKIINPEFEREEEYNTGKEDPAASEIKEDTNDGNK